MFSLNFPHQSSDYESSLRLKSQSCTGMKPYVSEHKTDFHAIFSTDKNDSPVHNEYALALRLLIEDFKNCEATHAGNKVSDLPEFHEQLSDQVYEQLSDILSEINNQASIPETGKYKPLKFDGELADKIDAWTESITRELAVDDEYKKNQLKGQVDFFFDSLIDKKNSDVFVEEVKNFFTGNNNASQGRKEFIAELSSRYPVNKRQIAQLIDLIEPNRYSLKNMINVLVSMNKEYEISSKKMELAGTAGRFMAGALAGALGSFAKSSAFGIFLGNALIRGSVSLSHSGRMKQINLLEGVKSKLNHRIAEALMLSEFGNVDDEKFAEIHTILGRGRASTAGLISTLIGRTTPLLMTLGSSLGFMGAIHPLLGVASLSSLPFMVRKAAQFLPKYDDLQRMQRESQKESTQNVKDITDTAEDVLTSPNPDLISEDLEASLNKEDEHSIEMQKLNHQLQHSFESIFWNTLTATGALGYGLYRGGEISEGQAISSSFIAGGIASPFLNLVVQSTDLLTSLQRVQEMEELIYSGEKISLEEDALRPGVSSLDNFDIEFKNLDFVGDDNKVILEDISLYIPQGSFLTITGRSGGGKSTLMKCLLGLYKPTNGSVNIGGVPRNELRQNGEDSVKASIACSGQAPKVLSGKTLRENLTLYSYSTPDDEKLKEVLVQLGLSEFVDKLDEPITKPSGGQRARIGIARALLKGDGSSKIIVLDEPTSGLDIETRGEVVDTLQKLHEDRGDLTIICVTHNDVVKQRIGNNFDLSHYLADNNSIKDLSISN